MIALITAQYSSGTLRNNSMLLIQARVKSAGLSCCAMHSENMSQGVFPEASAIELSAG